MVDGIQDAGAVLNGNPNTLLDSVNLDAKDLQLGAVPEGFLGCQLEAKS